LLLRPPASDALSSAWHHHKSASVAAAAAAAAAAGAASGADGGGSSRAGRTVYDVDTETYSQTESAFSQADTDTNATDTSLPATTRRVLLDPSLESQYQNKLAFRSLSCWLARNDLLLVLQVRYVTDNFFPIRLSTLLSALFSSFCFIWSRSVAVVSALYFAFFSMLRYNPSVSLAGSCATCSCCR
jgi:hypothetical protein